MDLRSVQRACRKLVRHGASMFVPVLILFAAGSVTLAASPGVARAQVPNLELTDVQHDAQGWVTANVVAPAGVALDGIEALIDGSAVPATIDVTEVASGTPSGSATYAVRLEAPILASGHHDLVLRLTSGDATQEVVSTFEASRVIALGNPVVSDEGSRIEVPILALLPLDALGAYSFEATAGRSSLPLAGSVGPIVIDTWQFAAGALPIEVSAIVDGATVSRVVGEVTVPALPAELVHERGVAPDGSGDEALTINWRAQGADSQLLVTSGADELVRTAELSVVVPVAAGAEAVLRVVGRNGAVLAEQTSAAAAPVAPPVGAPATAVESGEGQAKTLLPLAAAILAGLAILGLGGTVVLRGHRQRRWRNARGAGAISPANLRAALSNGEMTLHYQPILDVRDDRLVGVEALVRWEHPEFGTVSPRRFLAKAEAAGMMREIGEFVLRTACEFVRELHASRLPGVRLTVNVTASQLEDPAFPDAVARTLAEGGLEARFIEFEVSERASLASPDVIEALRRLRAMGVAIALDDYWAEALSAEQLKALSISSVKVDLWSNTGSRGARLRIQEAVEMARGLGVTVTAKRVETLHEVDFLRELECDYAQGHAFNEPMPEDVFLARMGLFEKEEPLAS